MHSREYQSNSINFKNLFYLLLQISSYTYIHMLWDKCHCLAVMFSVCSCRCKHSPLSAFLDTPVTTRASSMATSEKQNNLRTTRILPQAESEKTASPQRSDANQQEKTPELSFLRYLKHIGHLGLSCWLSLTPLGSSRSSDFNRETPCTVKSNPESIEIQLDIKVHYGTFYIFLQSSSKTHVST